MYVLYGAVNFFFGKSNGSKYEETKAEVDEKEVSDGKGEIYGSPESFDSNGPDEAHKGVVTPSHRTQPKRKYTYSNYCE